MKEQIKIALWNKVKSTYPSGTSKHTNALLEEDFDSFIEDVVKICTIPAVVGRSEQLVNFLLHLNGKGLINNHDFDYEKEAKKYLKKLTNCL